jgi:hypothetical protein
MVTTTVDTMVRTALGRLRNKGVFITMAPGPRAHIDQVLCGILQGWVGGELEYRIVASPLVYGLVVATAPDAAWHVDDVDTTVLGPYLARVNAQPAH